MENNFTDDELASWELESYEVDSWLTAGNLAHFVFKRLQSYLYFSVIRSEIGMPLCLVLGQSEIDSNGIEITHRELNFHTPIPLHEVYEMDAEVIEQVLEGLDYWREKVNEFASELDPIAWLPVTGRRIPDRPYVILSALFVFLQNLGSDQAVEVCSNLLGTNYETAKSRIRYARIRGFLSKPGHGSNKKSTLTKLGLQKLKEELG